MPCNSDYPTSTDYQRAKELVDMRVELDLATAIACHMCRDAIGEGLQYLMENFTKDEWDWWRRHELSDRDRLIKEISGLLETEEQRRVLTRMDDMTVDGWNY